MRIPSNPIASRMGQKKSRGKLCLGIWSPFNFIRCSHIAYPIAWRDLLRPLQAHRIQDAFVMARPWFGRRTTLATAGQPDHSIHAPRIPTIRLRSYSQFPPNSLLQQHKTGLRSLRGCSLSLSLSLSLSPPVFFTRSPRKLSQPGVRERDKQNTLPPLHSSKNSTCTQKPHIKRIHIDAYSWDERRRRHRQNPKKA